MQIRKLTKEEHRTALQLALDVFMQFEAPIYSEEGKLDFSHFIKDVAPGMEIDYYGAFDGEKLVGMMACVRYVILHWHSYVPSISRKASVVGSSTVSFKTREKGQSQ